MIFKGNSRRSKILLWTAGGFAALFILLLIAALVVPGFLSHEPIRRRILAELSKNLGGEVTARGLEISILPLPHIVLHDFTWVLPGKITATVDSLTAYPAVYPLLRGRIRISSLAFDSPVLEVAVHRRGEREGGAWPALSRAELKESVSSTFDLMQTKAPDLSLALNDGTIILLDGSSPVFQFQDVNGSIDFPPERLTVDITCTSSLWKRLAFQGHLGANDFEGRGSIRLDRMRPEPLVDYFFPQAADQVGDSEINLTLDFNTSRFSTLDARLGVSDSTLTIAPEEEQMSLDVDVIEAALHMEEARQTLSFHEVSFDYPKLDMDGKLTADQKARNFAVELNGRDVDVGAVRKVALAVLGKVETVQKVFDVLRDGMVPRISYGAHGSTLLDLKELENTTISGALASGEIFVPKAELPLDNVSGDVEIEKGILRGKDLRARMGSSLGWDGTLVLGLTGPAPPFQLDLLLKANLAQFPPILQRLVKNKAFQRELELVEEFSGNAMGRLILGDSLKSVDVHASASDFNLLARYKRLPYPLKAQGSRFTYDVKEVAVENTKAEMGGSSLSLTGTSFNWEKRPFLQVEADGGSVALGELFPWLTSHQVVKDALKNFQSMEGVAAIEAADFEGPLFRRDEWKFRIAGAVDDLEMDSPIFPARLSVPEGRFEAGPKVFSFENARGRMLDSALKASGSMDGYLGERNVYDIAFDGRLGPKSVQWVSKTIQLPVEPVEKSVLVSKAHLVWRRPGEASFSGNMTVSEGPVVAVALVRKPDELNIERLFIRDSLSRATLSLQRGEGELTFGFEGNLSGKTVDELLQHNPILTGWIRGDFTARVLPEQPLKSTAKGEIEGEGLEYPDLKIPLNVESFSVAASEDQLDLRSAVVRYDGNRITLGGDVQPTVQGFLVNLDASTDGIDWDEVRKAAAVQTGDDEAPGKAIDFWALPLQGTIALNAGYFKYENFLWKPFRSKIFLNPNDVTIAVSEASLCGISTPGTVKWSPAGMQMEFSPSALSRPLDPALTCLWSEENLATGDFSLDGQVTAQGKASELTGSLAGNVEFDAREGRIYRLGLLSKIFSLLNVTEIFVGTLPDLVNEGFAYNSIKANGDLREGKLIMDEGIINAPSMNLVWSGEVNLVSRELDMTVLVVPLKTLDRIIRHLPLISHILGSSFASIPVKVTGTLSDPTVFPLEPSAVGSELLGIVKRTLELPIKIIQPLTPDNGE